MDPRIREDDNGPGLKKKKIATVSTNEQDLSVSSSVLFRVIPWQMLFFASVANCLTLVKLLDTALA
jgi:hypothetical protein